MKTADGEFSWDWVTSSRELENGVDGGVSHRAATESSASTI